MRIQCSFRLSPTNELSPTRTLSSIVTGGMQRTTHGLAQCALHSQTSLSAPCTTPASLYASPSPPTLPSSFVRSFVVDCSVLFIVFCIARSTTEHSHFPRLGCFPQPLPSSTSHSSICPVHPVIHTHTHTQTHARLHIHSLACVVVQNP